MVENFGKKVLLSVFSVLILGFILYGIRSRPIVYYRLNCPQEISIPYHSEIINKKIGLGISNSGKTGASVILHLYGKNITINETKKRYIKKINKSNISIRFSISKNSPSYSFEEVNIVVNESVSGFSFRYNVDKNPDFSISGIINRFFGKTGGLYPTECKYKKADREFILQE